MTPGCRYAGQSDLGRVRTKNEDRWVADPTLGLYMVIDGMGGHPAGDLAASFIAQAFPEQVRQLFPIERTSMDDEFVHRTQGLLSTLSNTLVEQTRGEFGLEGLGATVVALLVRGRRALVAHQGDSRAYLVRESRLTCLTKDHTVFQLLLDRGEIAAEEMATHPTRHQLTRYIGLEDAPAPDVYQLEVCPGDRLLLCSDGLTSMVNETQLLSLLTSDRDPREVCQQLISAANDAGGRDNITVVIVVVDGEHRSQDMVDS